MRVPVITAFVFLLAGSTVAVGDGGPLWPPPPDEPRVQYVSTIDCSSLRPQTGFMKRLVRFIGGAAEDETLGLPFDVLVGEEKLYLTCQNLAALVEVSPDAGTYRLHECEDRPFDHPIALGAGAGQVFVTDSGNGTVYRFDGRKVEPLIEDGLLRPTGIGVVTATRRLYVVDTGAHAIKVFDFEGRPLGSVGERAAADAGLNFPTFAVTDGEALLVNDTLNYRIKRYDGDGALLSAFGREGDGPGTFARPKGLAVDGDGHVYVADALFDNIQVFDGSGRLLLVVGARGQGPGEFWSPGGIDVAGDAVYVADTFNNRVQVLRYLGDG
jgi:hypothetical protein